MKKCTVYLDILDKTIEFEIDENNLTLDGIVESLLKTQNVTVSIAGTDKKERLEKKVSSLLKNYLSDYIKEGKRRKRGSLAKRLLSGQTVVGNETIDTLKNKFPQLSFDDAKLEDKEGIILDTAQSYNGVGFGGKTTINGKSYFIIDGSEYSVKNLLKYLEIRSKLKQQELNFVEAKDYDENQHKDSIKIYENEKIALEYLIKKNKNIKNYQSALKHFFNHPNAYIYDVVDGLDIYTTLSDLINRELLGKYTRRDYGDNFINSILHRTKFNRLKYERSISLNDVKKLMRGFLESDPDREEDLKSIDDMEDSDFVNFFKVELERHNFPVQFIVSKSGIIRFKEQYNTFNSLGLGTMDQTELAIQAEYDPKNLPNSYGYNIYQINGKYYVSKQKNLTRDSKALEFPSLDVAIEYVKRQIKIIPLGQGFSRDTIGLSELETSISIRPINKSFSPSINTVFTGITNYDIPKAATISELISDNYKEYLNKPITELVKEFNLEGKINSYEDGIIFLIELSKYKNRSQKTIDKVIKVIEGLQKKEFLVVNKVGGDIKLQQLTEKQDKWGMKTGDESSQFAIPIIVPLTNLAERINNKAGKTLVKIITDSDFSEKDNPFKNVNKDANGFILGGIIYINASRARMSDLTHEMGHLFLGMVKATNMDVFMDLMNKLSDIGIIESRKAKKAQLPEYQFLSDEDLTEEVFVDLFAEYAFKTNKNFLSEDAEQNLKEVSKEDAKKMKNILVESVKNFGSSLIGATTLDNIFKNFSVAMKNGLFQTNGLDFDVTLTAQRRASNFIAKQLASDSKLIEKVCE